MNRRSFFNRIARAAAIVALAPQIAFRTKAAAFEVDGGLQWRCNTIGIREQLKQCASSFKPTDTLDFDDFLKQVYAIKRQRGNEPMIAFAPEDAEAARRMVRAMRRLA